VTWAPKQLVWMWLPEMFQGAHYFPFGSRDVLVIVGTLHADNGFSKAAVLFSWELEVPANVGG